MTEKSEFHSILLIGFVERLKITNCVQYKIISISCTRLVSSYWFCFNGAFFDNWLTVPVKTIILLERYFFCVSYNTKQSFMILLTASLIWREHKWTALISHMPMKHPSAEKTHSTPSRSLLIQLVTLDLNVESAATSFRFLVWEITSSLSLSDSPEEGSLFFITVCFSCRGM